LIEQTQNDPVCVMVAPSPEGQGGVSSVIKVYEQAGFFADGRVVMLPSFMNGSVFLKLKYAVSSLAAYALLLLRGKGAVLHVHVSSRASFWRKAIFIWMAFFSGRRIIFHLHGNAFLVFMDGLPGVLRFCAIATMNRCDQILCLASTVGAYLQKLTPDVPVRWWPNPIPADLFDLNVDAAPREAKVLFLGALTKPKGVFDLLDAFTELHRLDPAAQLIMCGVGPAHQTLADEAKKRGMQDSVVFTGWIDTAERKRWLARARVLALASHSEGQPMVLLEAMASGLPVVTTDVGGVSDMIVTGVDGLVLPAHDPKAFAQALILLWQDAALRERLAGAAVRSAKKLHRAGEVCAALDRLYQDTITRSGQRHPGSAGLALRYRLTDLARGADSVGLFNKLLAWQYLSPEQLNYHARYELINYFDDLRTALPMYKDVRRFEDLAIIDKSFIRQHQAALMNPRYTGRVFRKKTGGSTGEPLVYFTGAQAQSYLWAGIYLSWNAAGYRFGDRVAFLAGSSLFGTGSRQRIYYGLLNVTVMSSFNMSAASMTEYGARLQSDGFRLLYGYSAAVHRLARFYLDAGQTLKTRLRGIVCTAEALTPAMRSDIEAAFGVPCYGQYGCNDAGVSAFECEQRNGYHLISTRCHTEVLADGSLIGTDLSNRAMFMPRYRTGDIVRMAGRICPCGRGLPLIDEVVGRQNDMVLDATGNAVHSEFFTHMFREDARIHSFQVLFTDTVLSINLHVNESGANEFTSLEAQIHSRVSTVLQFSQVLVLFNHPFKITENGKHRFVMRDAN